MTLNELFARGEISPEDVIVLRHRPFEPELAKVLGWLAAEHPTVFNAYQQTQGPILEKSMLKLVGKGYIASFLAHGAGKAIFVGLYTVKASHPLTLEQYWEVQEYQQMKQYGMMGFTAAEGRPTIEWFDLELIPFRGRMERQAHHRLARR